MYRNFIKCIICLLSILLFGCSNNNDINNIEVKSNNSVVDIKKKININFKFFTNYKEAIVHGVKNNKKLFIIFATEYCGWCRKLKKDILNSKKTQKILLENYIPLFLDRDEKNSYPARQYTVSSVPAMYITTSDGNLILLKRVGYYKQEKIRTLLNNFK